MEKCKKGISWCNLFILVTVFCLIDGLKVVSADGEVEDVILETDLPLTTATDLPSEEPHIFETIVPHTPTEPRITPPLLHHPSIEEPSTDLDTSSDLPQTSSFVFHDTEANTSDGDDLQSDSFMGFLPIKVQKCCKPQQVLQLDQFGSECVDTQVNFVVDVFWANKTHYWNFTTSTAGNVTLVTRNPCNESKYILDPQQDVNDTFHLLHNSSLYVPYTMDMWNVDDYCVDVIMTSSTTLLTAAVICTDTPKTSAFHYLFGTGLLISVISLIILAVYSMWRTDIDDDHKKCLAFFAGTMATSFFFVAISVFFGRKLPNIVNILLAYVVYYLKLKYFIWLNVLCYDTYRCVKLATDGRIERDCFIKRYMWAAFVTPLIFIAINLFDRCNPALPNLYLEFSYSSSFLWALLLFYVPTIISVSANVWIMCSIVLPKGKCKDLNELLAYLRSEKWKPTLAPEEISQLRNMYRRTCILCGFMLIFLVLDLVIFLIPSHGQQQAQFMIRNVVYCLQGLFVAGIFIKKNCCQRTTENKHDTTENCHNTTEMELLKSDSV